MAKEDARVHYIRALSKIDKMYQYFFEKNSLSDGESEYYSDLFFKQTNYKQYDANNFLILCAIALMGINKESCEEALINKGYEYKVDYPIKDFDTIVDTYMKAYKLPKENRKILYDLLKQRHDAYPFFNDKRSITTPYDKWLKVNKQNNLPNFTYNYLSCVRDAFMHSEYGVYKIENEGDVTTGNVLPITNNDYKKFEAEIFIPNFLDFVKFYYSSTAYYGVMRGMYSIGGNIDDLKLLKSDEELKAYIDSRMLIRMDIKNTSLSFQDSFEFKKLKNKGLVFNANLDDENIDSEEVEFKKEDKDKVFKIIKQSYGDEFFELSLELQQHIVFMVTNYLFDPRLIISSCIIALYENEAKVNKGSIKYINLSKENYCVKASMLLLKAYLVLYRIQNENFEEINYDDVYLANIGYTESDPYRLNLYNEFKNKLINKGIILDDVVYQKMFQTEIIRDSLAHGNIDLKIDDDLNQYFIFDDDYHGKHRIITICLDEFSKYLASPAFSRASAKIKQEEITRK